jgi:hypothetical protein
MIDGKRQSRRGEFSAAQRHEDKSKGCSILDLVTQASAEAATIPAPCMPCRRESASRSSAMPRRIPLHPRLTAGWGYGLR